MGLLKTAGLLALLACAPFLIDLASRQEYPVPQGGGGVIVTCMWLYVWGGHGFVCCVFCEPGATDSAQRMP